MHFVINLIQLFDTCVYSFSVDARKYWPNSAHTCILIVWVHWNIDTVNNSYWILNETINPVEKISPGSPSWLWRIFNIFILFHTLYILLFIVYQIPYIFWRLARSALCRKGSLYDIDDSMKWEWFHLHEDNPRFC
jgi:hypothetical protein